MFNAPILQDEQKTREGPQNSTNAIVEDVYKMRPWLWQVSNTAHTSASTHRIMFIHMLSIMTKVLYWPMGRGPDQTSLLGHHWAQQNTWGRSTVKHIPENGYQWRAAKAWPRGPEADPFCTTAMPAWEERDGDAPPPDPTVLLRLNSRDQGRVWADVSVSYRMETYL